MTEQLRDRRKHKFITVDTPILTDCELSDGAFRLYCVLIRYAGNDNGCWPGVTRLAKDTGKSEASIKRLLGELTTRGLISRQRRFKRSSVTWLEDVLSVYHSNFDTCIKNELSANLSYIAQLKNDTTELDTELNIIDTDVVSLLLGFGVDRVQAEKLAKKGVTLELAQSWIEYTKGRKLQNPQGFVVSRLTTGEFPPTETGKEDQEDTSRYLCKGSQFDGLILS